MILSALVVDPQVRKLPFYDPQTGRDVSDYVVELLAFDRDHMPQRYGCQVVEGLPSLDKLRRLKQSGECLEEVERVVGVLHSEVLGSFPLGQQLFEVQLDVLGVKYEMAGLYGEEIVIKLVCRLVVGSFG